MNVILFDDPAIRTDLFPFTYIRPVGKIRVGILTIDEKWGRRLGSEPSFLTEGYLQKKFFLKKDTENLLINGAVCPDDKLVAAIKTLQPGEVLRKEEIIIASRQKSADIPFLTSGKIIDHKEPITVIDAPWKIFTENAGQLNVDFSLITKGRSSHGIGDKHTIVYGGENLFVEEGVNVKAAVINAENGPVYLGVNSTIQEGAIIRGSFALCEGAYVNMGAKMRGDTTIGPYSKVGGEVSTSVIQGYSNKAHDGFLGCSVIGEWCNLGAGTNTSNLKNNYDTVKTWNHRQESFIDTGLQFCGLMMGDHSKCSINTMFNTGTVVDVSANIFGEGFPHNHVPSFSWGGSKELTTYLPDKAIEVARRAMARRAIELDDIDREIMRKIFELTARSRRWEPENRIYNT